MQKIHIHKVTGKNAHWEQREWSHFEISRITSERVGGMYTWVAERSGVRQVSIVQAHCTADADLWVSSSAPRHIRLSSFCVAIMISVGVAILMSKRTILY